MSRYRPGFANVLTLNVAEAKPPEIEQAGVAEKRVPGDEVSVHTVSAVLNPDPLTATNTGGPIPGWTTAFGETVICARGAPILNVPETLWPKRSPTVRT